MVESDNFKPSITLLIPTKDRSEFVVRQLRYYQTAGFRGTISIGDSSESEHRDRVAQEVLRLSGDLDIRHDFYPGLLNAETMQNMLRNVTTDYVAFIGDDDFLTVRGINRCVDFLDRNPGYVSANGTSVIFTLESPGAYGTVKSVSNYYQKGLGAGTAQQRFLDYMGDYFVPLFSVHRAPAFALNFKYATEPRDKLFSLELLPCCLSAVQGPSKHLRCLYLIRQFNPSRFPLPDTFDWITGTDWPGSYEFFVDVISAEIAGRDGVDLAEAKDAVKNGLWQYLALALSLRWENKYGTNSRNAHSTAYRVAAAVPGVREVWHSFRRSILRGSERNTLGGLLRRSSRYHSDFKDIYQAVTAPAVVV